MAIKIAPALQSLREKRIFLIIIWSVFLVLKHSKVIDERFCFYHTVIDRFCNLSYLFLNTNKHF